MVGGRAHPAVASTSSACRPAEKCQGAAALPLSIPFPIRLLILPAPSPFSTLYRYLNCHQIRSLLLTTMMLAADLPWVHTCTPVLAVGIVVVESPVPRQRIVLPAREER